MRQKGQYDNALPSINQNSTRIMKEILKTSTIIVLGNLIFIPLLLILSSTLISCVIGVAYLVVLFYILSSTRIGRRFFAAFYAANLRLEKEIFGCNSEC